MYPQNYHNNARCETVITAPEGYNVVLKIDDFLLENDEISCPGNYDTLSIYHDSHDEQNLIGVYCGTEIPEQFISDGRTLYLHFKSDSTVTSKGFHASYYFLSSKLKKNSLYYVSSCVSS